MTPNKSLMSMLFLSLVITLALPPGLLARSTAQEEQICEDLYTVQAGDWLSKIAEKYYGDLMAYNQIVTATNGQSDQKFATIENPDLIEVGWLLCIPGVMREAAETAAVPEPVPTTEIIVFDPNAFETDSNRAPVQGLCQTSTYVPGAYQCSTENGATLDPCFARSDNTLVCNPNPVFGSYSQVVTPTESLPESSQTGEPVSFYLELAGNNPPCQIRTTGNGYEIAGKPVTYNCDAPAAWILGPLDTSQPAWVAEYVITNPSTGEVTYGPTPLSVSRAWFH